jgi:hypothetical protein
LAHSSCYTLYKTTHKLASGAKLDINIRYTLETNFMLYHVKLRLLQREVFNIKDTVELPLFLQNWIFFKILLLAPPPPRSHPRHPARKSFCGPWQVKTFGILLNYNMQTKIGAELPRCAA